MRVSVEIDEATVEAAMALTGEKNKSPALAKAVVEFVRRQQARQFGRMIREGVFDYPDPDMDEGGRDPANPVPPLTEH